MMKKVLLCILASLAALTALADDATTQNTPYFPDGVVFKVADTTWDVDGLGNHRAVVKASAGDCKAIKAELKWRRPDRRTGVTGLVVKGAATGAAAENYCIENATSESATVWFEPIKGENTYYVYYMPQHPRQGHAEARFMWDYNDYILYDAAKGSAWKASLGGAEPAEGEVTAFEAINGFEAFTQMGNIATAKETAELAAKHPENPVIFTENRCFAIRLTDRLPVRWVTANGPSNAFKGEACKNEYYVWQIGLWAAHGAVSNVKVEFSDLKQDGGKAVIPAAEQTCFNTEGTNWDCTHMDIDLDVPEGKIQALWCGVQVPGNAPSGVYKGTATVTGDGMAARTVEFTLNVTGETLADRGEGDLWRLSRLSWLNSTIGADETPIGNFKAIKAKGQKVTATEKTMVLGKNGLPASIVINDKEVLAKPVRFEVETSRGTIRFDGGSAKPEPQTDGYVTWSTGQTQDGIRLTCEGRMIYDGQMLYTVNISSDKPVQVKDIRLVADYTPYASRYLMGIGYEGGYRPEKQVWDWSGLYDSFWMGNVLAGLHMEFRGDDAYHGPLLRDYKKNAPAAWFNDGKGRVSVATVSGGAEMVASTGACTVTAEPREFKLSMNITPAKPVDTKKQFDIKIYHNKHIGFDKAAEDGANYCNIHHAQVLNPVINYPFIVQEPLKEFIRHEHENGRYVKLYYTIRELTNYVAEGYALKSLNHEVIQGGKGGGAPWLVEHFIDDYWPAWYFGSKELGYVDAAWVTSPQSRWINYYLEGLRWMVENYDIDGLYMDDISFDGTVMRRLRTAMDLVKPGCVIDLHSNTGYSNGPMNQYCDYMPFVDRLWFGESYRYNQMSPDNWFVTFSGIPFGPMSEMLQDGGNPWLGTVFATTSRHSYGKFDPSPVWKAWDNFGIRDARMIGWWDEGCPVTTSDDLVKATSYVKKGSTLVAIGNFSTEDKTITLDIDWKALKLKAGKVTCTLPEIKDFQNAGSYKPGSTITIPAKKGVMIVIE